MELEAVIEMTQEFSDATETEMNFVNDLLHYESMEAGQFAIDPSPTRPEDIVKPTTIKIVAKRSNLSLVVVPPICVPEDKVCNYLFDSVNINHDKASVNACKFTPSGGTVVIETSITCKEKNGRASSLLFTPPRSEFGGTVRIKVFQRFVQFNKNELQGGGGSGPGLWIARRIVNLHSGELSFVSDGPGRGIFLFLIFHFS
jgi:K+-sensing histidine kinase KdpD